MMQPNYWLQRRIDSFYSGARRSSLQVGFWWSRGPSTCDHGAHRGLVAGGHRTRIRLQGDESDFRENFAFGDLEKLILMLSGIFRVWCS